MRVRLDAGSIGGYIAIALVALPVVAGTLYSAVASIGLVGTGAAGASGGAIARTLASAETWASIGWTVYTAGAATLIALVAALAVAVPLQHSAVGRWIATFPLAVPYLVAGLAALLLLGQSGLLSRALALTGAISTPAQFPALVYDRAGVALILSFAWKEFPFLALTAFAVLDTRGDALADTARSLGASARATFTRVTLPLLLRGTMPATIAGFAFLVGQYELAALLAPSDPQPLSVLTYERASDPDLSRRAEAHVLALVAMGLCGGLVAMHAASVRRAASNDRR